MTGVRLPNITDYRAVDILKIQWSECWFLRPNNRVHTESWVLTSVSQFHSPEPNFIVLTPEFTSQSADFSVLPGSELQGPNCRVLSSNSRFLTRNPTTDFSVRIRASWDQRGKKEILYVHDYGDSLIWLLGTGWYLLIFFWDTAKRVLKTEKVLD